jgi:hypothetical protein
LVEPAIEAPNDVDQLARLFDAQLGPQIALADVQARKLIELATDLIEAPSDLGHLGGVVVVGSGVLGRLGLFVPGVIADDRVEPLADRHAGAARGIPRGLARRLRYALHFPRNARCHARIHGSTEEEREPDGPL